VCDAVQSIAAVVDKMKAAGAPVELFMYEHCGHAFMNALTAGGRDKIKGGLGWTSLQTRHWPSTASAHHWHNSQDGCC